MATVVAVRQSTRAGRAALIAAFAAIYLIWGSTYLAIAWAVETIPPLLMMGVRFLAAGGLVYGWARWKGDAPPEARAWLPAAWTGALLFVATHGLIGWASLRAPSGLVALLGATVPLWMVVLEWAGEGERPTARVFLGLAAGLLGMTVLVAPGLAEDGGVDVWAALAVVLAAFTWSLGSVGARRRTIAESRAVSVGMQLLAGGGMLVVASVLAGERLEVAEITLRSALALGYLTVFGSIVAFTTYVWLMQVSTASRVSTHAFVNPMVAVLVGWLAGEAVGGRMLVAGGLIALAVIWITTTPRGPSVRRPGATARRERHGNLRRQNARPGTAAAA